MIKLKPNLRSKPGSNQKFIHFFTYNFSAKILAVIIAVFLFFTHRLSLFQEKQFTLTLQIKNNRDLLITNPYSKRVILTIREREKELEQLLKDDLEVYIDLKEQNKEGTFTFPIHLRHRNRPELLKNKEIILRPNSLTLRLSQSVTKQVEIKPDILKPPSDDFSFTYDFSPKKAIISGPREQLESIDKVLTDPLDLSVFQESFNFSIPLKPPTSLTRFVNTDAIQFNGQMKEKVNIKTLDSLKILSVDLPENMEILSSLPPLKMILQGTKKNLDRLVISSIYGTIDGSSISVPGRYQIPIQIRVPKEILVLDYEPQEVIVIVKEKEGGQNASGNRN